MRDYHDDDGRAGSAVLATLPQPRTGAGAVIWVTGLSGSGKTTVVQEMRRALMTPSVRPVMLDGDQLRDALGVSGSFDSAGRRRMAFTYARLCHVLSAQGQTVLCATISLFHDVHEWNRRNLEQYFEVLLDVPLGVLKGRDVKGIYTPSQDEDVVGREITPEFPTAPDLVVRNHGHTTPELAATRILQACSARGLRL